MLPSEICELFILAIKKMEKCLKKHFDKLSKVQLGDGIKLFFDLDESELERAIEEAMKKDYASFQGIFYVLRAELENGSVEWNLGIIAEDEPFAILKIYEN